MQRFRKRLASARHEAAKRQGVVWRAIAAVAALFGLALNAPMPHAIFF
jgi:hypothetical protein